MNVTLKMLLAEFNKEDCQLKGNINKDCMLKVCEKINLNKEILHKEQYFFDDLLLYYSAEMYSQFKSVLESYLKKCQQEKNFVQAQITTNKIRQINMRHKVQINRYKQHLQNKQIHQKTQNNNALFIQLCHKWDKSMIDFEKTSKMMIQSLKQIQKQQLNDYKIKCESKQILIHPTKQVIEMQNKVNALVKVKDYLSAQLVQERIDQISKNNLETIAEDTQKKHFIKIKAFQDRQKISIVSLLSKIQKQRKELLRKRKQESSKLIKKHQFDLQQITKQYKCL